jgi:hypothetical protein
MTLTTYRLWLWRNRRSRWPQLSAKELELVITSAAARERNQAVSSRYRHRSTRLAAVAFYRKQFGNADFLSEYSGRALPALKRTWLPGGYWSRKHK